VFSLHYVTEKAGRYQVFFT